MVERQDKNDKQNNSFKNDSENKRSCIRLRFFTLG